MKRKEESEGDVLCQQSNELNNHENLVFLALIHYAFCTYFKSNDENSSSGGISRSWEDERTIC